MATSASAVIDRVREICLGLEMAEAVGLDFARTPAPAMDGAFVVTYAGQPPIGGMSFTEESRGTLELAIARTTGGNYDTTRRALTDELTARLADVVRDGASDGEFSVADDGRALTVEGEKGAAYLIGRLRVGVNFESQL